MKALRKAVDDLNRREISWMDVPAPIRKELTAMEQGIHDADGEGPIVMKWYRMILKAVTEPLMEGDSENDNA